MIPSAIICSIWKERHDKIFRASSLSTIDLISRVISSIAKWASVRKELSNFNFKYVLFLIEKLA